MHRRQFLLRSALGGAGFLVLKSAPSAWTAQANNKLNVALIGVGGRGEWFVDTIPRMENVVAVCDVNQQKIDGAFQRWADGAKRYAASPHDWERRAADAYRRLAEHKPKIFRDFRKLLDQAGREIDAVVVSTPDHTHAVAAAAAIQAGKHVFCEKPLTRTVHESRALRELARRHRVATSMGNQGTASGPFRRALELIRDGTLGEIQEVHVWNTGGGADRQEPPAEGGAVPDFLDWDLWLGPAAFRPYHRLWMQRNLWRDFGTCQLGNWASHSANLAFMALKVHELWLNPQPSEPKPVIRVRAECSGINRLSFPRWEKITWEIPPRAEFPAIAIHWYNGAAPGAHDRLQSLLADGVEPGQTEETKPLDHAGAILVGTRGRLHATGHNATFRLLPEDRFQAIDRNRPLKVNASRGHEMDWFLACKGGQPAWANFDYASALNEFLMLGNVATQWADSLEFDPAAMRILNHAAADALLRPPYRQGWTL